MKRTLRSISASRCCLALVLAAGLGAPTVVAQSGSGSTSRDSRASTATTDRASTSRDSSSMRTSSTTSKLDKSDKAFLEKAAKSSMKEAALSQLAAQKAANSEVRQYAENITSDHQRVNQQLMQLAQSKGVTLDVVKHSGSTTTGSTRTTAGGPTSAGSTGIDRAQADATGGTMATAGTTGASTTGSMSHMAMSDDRDYKKLSKESGREFDEQYVELMVQEHEKAVELFEEAAEDVTDQEVRSFASMHVESLRQHLQEAKSLQRAVAE